jgi:hypothetical protein
MSTANPVAITSTSAHRSFRDRVNTEWHRPANRIFMVVVLAHWAEHLVQAWQIFVLGWPRPASRGVLGQFFPWVVTTEVLHYGYALVMLIGLWLLRPGFVGRAHRWWTAALVIQFWHHIEHLLLQAQVVVGKNIMGSPIPLSILQIWIPRVELHLFYNGIVFIPMVVAMYYHLLPSPAERRLHRCTCALKHHEHASPQAA